MTSSSAFPHATILGTAVTVSTFDEAVHALAARVRGREEAVFAAATVYSVMLGRKDPSYRTIVNSADYIMADGMPLVWAARSLGHEGERVHGDDLMLACCARHPEWRHYLLGGAEGQPEEVRDALHRRFPGIQVVGTRSTPIRPIPPDEDERIRDAIRAADADLVWVGMGTPAQDHWMAENRDRLGRPLVGVGSAFNLLSGRTRPTRDWMKRAGLQWFHRLAQEPRRLAPRYLVYNPLFLWHFGFQWLTHERGSKKGDQRSVS